ncbi:hypothetical protein Ciccas_006986 [Cichlidogyrus casuarinus]|uniref:Uncharacterized protein n=1 Tax=Cichlidogyrus casuarinus TaxID=1844966 RepID=A0ABD2Q597_9PLAT
MNELIPTTTLIVCICIATTSFSQTSAVFRNQYIYFRFCEEFDVPFWQNSTVGNVSQLDFAQAGSARYLMYLSLITFFIPMIMSLPIGLLSDRIGRKPIYYLAITSIFIQVVLNIGHMMETFGFEGVGYFLLGNSLLLFLFIYLMPETNHSKDTFLKESPRTTLVKVVSVPQMIPSADETRLHKRNHSCHLHTLYNHIGRLRFRGRLALLTKRAHSLEFPWCRWCLYTNPLAQLRRYMGHVQEEVSKEPLEQIWYTLVVRNSHLNSFFLLLTAQSRVAFALTSIASLSRHMRNVLIALSQVFAALSFGTSLSNLVGFSSLPCIYQATLKSSFLGTIYLLVASIDLIGLYANM